MTQESPYPFQEHLGFTITDWQQDYCRLEQPMRPYLGNRNGALHGGVSAALLDTAMGYACCYSADPDQVLRTVTLSLNVNYIGPPKGDVLITEARRVGGGRTTIFNEAILTDNAGNTIATATGVFRRIKMDDTQKGP